MKQFFCVKRHRDSQRGHAMVEFAFTATCAFLLIFGISRVGYAVYSYNTLAAATQEAAHYAATNGPNSPSPASLTQVQQVVQNFAPGLNAGNLQVNQTPQLNGQLYVNDPNLNGYQDAIVTVTYSYTFWMPVLGKVTLPMTATAQMLVSQ